MACTTQAFALTPNSPRYNDDLQNRDKKNAAGGPPILVPSGGDTITCPVDVYGTMGTCNNIIVLIKDGEGNTIGSNSFTPSGDGFWGGEISCEDASFRRNVNVTAFCADYPSKANSISGLILDGPGEIIVEDTQYFLTNGKTSGTIKAKKDGSTHKISKIKFHKNSEMTKFEVYAHELKTSTKCDVDIKLIDKDSKEYEITLKGLGDNKDVLIYLLFEHKEKKKEFDTKKKRFLDPRGFRTLFARTSAT